MKKDKPTYKELEEKILVLENKLNDKQKNENSIYFSLFNKLNFGVVIYEVIDNGREFIFKDINKTAEKIFKQKRKDLIGKKILDAHPNIKKIGLLETFREILKTGNSTYHNINEYNGKIISGSFFNYVFQIPTGEIITVFEDVCVREKSKKNLKESKEKLNKFVNHSRYIIYKYSTKRGNLFCSDRLFEISGYSNDEIKNTPFLFKNSLHPDDKKNIERALNDISFGEGNSIEYRVKTKSGKWIWLQNFVNRKIIIDDEIIIEGQVGEITAKKEAEFKLNKSQQRLQLSLKTNNASMFEANFVTNEMFFSPELFKYLGYTDSHIPKKIDSFLKFIMPDDLSGVLKFLKKNVNKKKFDCFLEYRACDKAGNWHWIESVGKVTKRKTNGEAVILTGISRDITQKRKSEQELKQSETKLRDSNTTKNKFFSIIAHDLINPFNSMLGFSKLLYENFEEFDQKKQKSFLGIVYKDLKITYNLLENLLIWSRSQNGKLNFTPERENLYLLINKTIELSSLVADNKKINIVNKINKEIFVNADNNMLSVILRNLVSNAIKFTPKCGEIILNAKNNNKFVQISVKDNGVGMLPKLQTELFQIKNTISTAGTEKEKGTGLGLIICKEFVEKHGGEIWVKSEMNKGSEFLFTIPESV
ncbi:MAG: PAS domain-containing protein [Bacteroidetes bacterium]|nr:PAS domain-containing protein [Bacteroidota bacterium]